MTTLTTTMAVKVRTATPRGKVTAVIGFPCFSETDSLSWSCGQQDNNSLCLALVLRIRVLGLTYQLFRVGVIVVAVAICWAGGLVVLLLGMSGQQWWRRGKCYHI